MLNVGGKRDMSRGVEGVDRELPRCGLPFSTLPSALWLASLENLPLDVFTVCGVEYFIYSRTPYEQIHSSMNSRPRF